MTWLLECRYESILWLEENLDVRFYILNRTDSDWEETTVILKYPEG